MGPRAAPTWWVAACVCLVWPTAHGYAAQRKIEFPAGRIDSPSGDFWAEFTGLKSNGDGSGEYRLVVRNRDNLEVTKYDFDRAANAQWADASDTLVVNDYQGSNVTDCAVLLDPAHNTRFQSLSALLPKQGLQGWNPADMKVDHSYLTCGEWIDATHLRAELRGYDDNGRAFDHRMVLDTRTRTLKNE